MDHPEGALERGDGRLGFDRRVRLEFRGTQLSSDGGLLVMRELDVRVTAIQTQTERKRQDSSVRRAEKLRRRAGMARLCGPINPHSGTLTIAAELGNTKLLIMRLDKANLTSSGRPHGECRLKDVCEMKISPLLALLLALQSVGASAAAQDFTGLCLDMLEEGCMPRHVPLFGNTIDFCEESCELTGPVAVRGLDATLYDLQCRGDYGVIPDKRVMFLSQQDEMSGPRTFWVDSDNTFQIVGCP